MPYNGLRIEVRSTVFLSLLLLLLLLLMLLLLLRFCLFDIFICRSPFLLVDSARINCSWRSALITRATASKRQHQPRTPAFNQNSLGANPPDCTAPSARSLARLSPAGECSSTVGHDLIAPTLVNRSLIAYSPSLRITIFLGYPKYPNTPIHLFDSKSSAGALLRHHVRAHTCGWAILSDQQRHRICLVPLLVSKKP